MPRRDRGPYPTDVLRERVKELRKLRGMNQQELADRIAELGGTLTRGTLAKIESATRSVSLDEALVLAAALNVSPASLFLPSSGDEWVSLTPEVEQNAATMREWVAGRHPLLAHDDIDDYVRAAPTEVATRVGNTDVNAAELLVQSLVAAVTEKHDAKGRAELVKRIRRAIGRATSRAEAVISDLETGGYGS